MSLGELHLKVTDPHGFGVKGVVELTSESNQFHNTFSTDVAGTLVAKRLPFGLYRLQVEQAGFAPVSVTLEVRSAVPVEYHVELTLPSVNTSVTVQATETLIDPHRSKPS